MTTVGLYARTADGDALDIARQIEDVTAFAAGKGWATAPEPYIDNGVSAYTMHRGKRPAFDRLLADLTAGKIDGIVAYDLDRITRNPRDLESVLAVIDQDPARVLTFVSGELDRGMHRLTVTANASTASRRASAARRRAATVARKARQA